MQEEKSFNRNVSVSDDSNTMTSQPETEDGKQGRSSLVTFRTTKEPSFDDESVLVVSYKNNSRDSESLDSEESTDIIGSSSKEFKIARKWIMNSMIDKKQENKSYSMKVASPTVIKASETWIPLTLEVIPYVNESTEWPDRFSYLQAHLKIPHNLVFLLTISHHCTLHLAISVSADNPASPLLDLPRPLQLKFPVPQGVLEYTTEMTKFLRHTTH